ncbi:hypothetical protein [Metallibacterium scheffleri]|uniref:hypothetical protein n=1 Tax=Metallibacterium scheffleri TaxID=993689 RepID=UPI0023F52281|nr:hypothetical protein [Metallibacterium scheffleri]
MDSISYVLAAAALDGGVEGVKTSIAAGADIHAVDDVALRLASLRGHQAIVRIFLAAGADPVTTRSVAGQNARAAMAVTLDACADVMTPAQRNTLLDESKQWVRLRSVVESASKHPTPRR